MLESDKCYGKISGLKSVRKCGRRACCFIQINQEKTSVAKKCGWRKTEVRKSEKKEEAQNTQSLTDHSKDYKFYYDQEG